MLLNLVFLSNLLFFHSFFFLEKVISMIHNSEEQSLAPQTGWVGGLKFTKKTGILKKTKLYN